MELKSRICMNINRYRHNYEVFSYKFTYSMSINKGERPQLKVIVEELWKLSHLFSLSLSKEH